MTKKTIGLLAFSKHTDAPLRERINTRFIEEIEKAGYEGEILYYDLFSVFYKQKSLEIYYDNNKFISKKYLCVIPQYYFLNYQFANNAFIVTCLNQAGVKTFNPLEASQLAKNKRESLFLLAMKGLPIIPTGINFSQFFLDQHLKRNEGKKVVAKANLGSMGYGVSVLDSPISFISFMEFMGATNQPVNTLIQPFVEAQGEDYRVFVVGNKVVAVMKRKAKGIEFRANVSKGGSAQSIRPSKKMADLAVRASRLLGLEYAGVDIVRVKNKLMIVEVNTNPGLEIEKITGVNVVEKVIKHVIMKAKK